MGDNADFTAGSTLRINVNAAGLNNSLNVTGNANFSPGARVSVNLVSEPAALTNYTLVTAAAVPGTLPTLVEDSAFFTEMLPQNAISISLQLDPTGGPGNTLAIARTPNQMAVAAAFDATAGYAQADLLRAKMATATLGEVLQTLDNLGGGGDALSTVITTNTALANRLDRIAHARIRRAPHLNYAPIFSIGRPTRRVADHSARDPLLSVPSDDPGRRAVDRPGRTVRRSGR